MLAPLSNPRHFRLLQASGAKGQLIARDLRTFLDYTPEDVEKLVLDCHTIANIRPLHPCLAGGVLAYITLKVQTSRESKPDATELRLPLINLPESMRNRLVLDQRWFF